MEISQLCIAVIISAIIAIVFRQKENTTMYAVFKPLTTILIILIAFLIYDWTFSNYSGLMIVALLFSLIGDVFLINTKYFLQGLTSFLVAHIVFTIGFTTLYGFDWNVIPLIPLALISGVYYNFLRKNLKKYSIPVLIYMIVIIVMNWQAINLAISKGDSVFLALAISSVLFSFSDAILAYNKFKKPFKLAEVLILSTYWTSILIFTMVGLYIGSA